MPSLKFSSNLYATEVFLFCMVPLRASSLCTAWNINEETGSWLTIMREREKSKRFYPYKKNVKAVSQMLRENPFFTACQFKQPWLARREEQPARPPIRGDSAVSWRAEAPEFETYLGSACWRRRALSSSPSSACYRVGVCDHACVCAHIFLSAPCHVRACSLCVCVYVYLCCFHVRGLTRGQSVSEQATRGHIYEASRCWR